MREAIEARGASLPYPPPYSTNLNPIGPASGKLKRLRSAARTVDALWNIIGGLLDRCSPEERTAYFRHCGHAQPER